MALLLLATFAGGLLTLVFLWSFGFVIAMAGAPIGASMAAALAGALIALRRRSEHQVGTLNRPAPISPEQPAIDVSR